MDGKPLSPGTGTERTANLTPKDHHGSILFRHGSQNRHTTGTKMWPSSSVGNNETSISCYGNARTWVTTTGGEPPLPVDAKSHAHLQLHHGRRNSSNVNNSSSINYSLNNNSNNTTKNNRNNINNISDSISNNISNNNNNNNNNNSNNINNSNNNNNSNNINNSTNIKKLIFVDYSYSARIALPCIFCREIL